ncbi:PqiA/YebS family transporter subunit [Halomonas sp. WWR20]
MSRRRLRACQQCDLVTSLPSLRTGEKATCPRCHHTLARRFHRPAERSLALAMAALIALGLAVSFPFVSFEAQGVNNRIELTETATSLIGFHEPIVAIVVLLTVVILPIFYLLGVIWLQIGLLRRRPLPRSRQIARSLAHLTPWMMADVFVIGALVSLVKVAGMADIGLGPSFWAYCIFALLLLMTNHSLDEDWMWFSLASEPLAPEGARTGETAAPQRLTGCPTCGLLNRLGESCHGSCQRCGEHLHTRQPYTLQRTWALLIAAVVMYIPANLYPIMTTTTLGEATPSTIIGGVLIFLQGGDWPIALIIFTASVVVPIGKILALAWLCIATRRGAPTLTHMTRIRLYRLTEFIGRWSMIDVFVVAILVALIHAGALMSVTPGPAALAFGSVVVITMLAAMSFDPRLIWDAPLHMSHTGPRVSAHDSLPTQDVHDE